MPTERKLIAMIDALRREILRQLVRVARYPIQRTASCNRVHFEVVSYDEQTFTAVCLILGRPCGCSRVPEEYGSKVAQYVDVVDCDECYFADESEADLIGRYGWADYYKPAAGSHDAYSDCFWAVSSLCCPPED